MTILVASILALALQAAAEGLRQDGASPARPTRDAAAPKQPPVERVASRGAIAEPASLLSAEERAGEGLPVARAFLVCDSFGADGAASESSERTGVRIGVGAIRIAAGRALQGAPSLAIAIGPVVLEPDARLMPATDWWKTWTTEWCLSIAPPSACRPLETDSAGAQSLARLRPIVSADASAVARAGKRHGDALDALARLAAAVGAEEVTKDVVPLRLPQSPALSTDLFEVVAWIELADARQAALRVRGETKAADLVVSDMRSLIKALRCAPLESLLSERVPSGAEGFASLVLHQSWPTDAWQLVDPLLRLRASLERTRKEFAELAARVGRERTLPAETISELKARLETVARNLPPGFEWTQGFENDCEKHMLDAFTPGASFGGAARAPAFDASDPVVASIYARTVAFEVFGFAWSQTGAMPPSMVQAREDRMSEVLAPFQSARADGSLVSRSGVDQGRVVLDMVRQYLGSEDSRWKPWVVFPASPEVAGIAAMQLRARVMDRLRDIDESFVPGGDDLDHMSPGSTFWAVDGTFAVDGNTQGRGGGERPWIFDDCTTMFWDGYVAVRKW